MGSGRSGELTFLDLISIISFCVGLQNLEINITQDDLQDMAMQADKRQSAGIEDIHRHLAIQDEKLSMILRILGSRGDINDSRRNL